MSEVQLKDQLKDSGMISTHMSKNQSAYEGGFFDG